MDEMKIGSKFTTSIISKLASLAIRKKFGYDVKLNLNEVKATVLIMRDGLAQLVERHTSVEVVGSNPIQSLLLFIFA